MKSIILTYQFEILASGFSSLVELLKVKDASSPPAIICYVYSIHKSVCECVVQTEYLT